jgi:hypothetical protein
MILFLKYSFIKKIKNPEKDVDLHHVPLTLQ